MRSPTPGHRRVAAECLTHVRVEGPTPAGIELLNDRAACRQAHPRTPPRSSTEQEASRLVRAVSGTAPLHDQPLRVTPVGGAAAQRCHGGRAGGGCARAAAEPGLGGVGGGRAGRLMFVAGVLAGFVSDLHIVHILCLVILFITKTHFLCIFINF